MALAGCRRTLKTQEDVPVFPSRTLVSSMVSLADGGKALLELNEGNNTRTQSITVTLSPDLIVEAFSAPDKAAASASIVVTETTKTSTTDV